MASHGIDPVPVAPYSVGLLADLHAGVLPASVSEQLWAAVREDPEAMKVIGALDAVTARLGAASASPACGESIPPEIAERIDRELEAASAHTEPTTSRVENVSRLANVSQLEKVTALGRRNHWAAGRNRIAVGVAAAVVAAVAVTTVVLNGIGADSDSGFDSGPDSGEVVAQPPTLVVDSGAVDDSVARDIMARPVHDDVLDGGSVPECLVANGFAPRSPVLGAAQVELDGRRAVMLVLPRNLPGGGLTLLAVAPECGAGNPSTLVRRDID